MGSDWIIYRIEHFVLGGWIQITIEHREHPRIHRVFNISADELAQWGDAKVITEYLPSLEPSANP